MPPQDLSFDKFSSSISQAHTIKILLFDNCVNPRYTSQNFEPMPFSQQEQNMGITLIIVVRLPPPSFATSVNKN
jgi:hypothetical protein